MNVLQNGWLGRLVLLLITISLCPSAYSNVSVIANSSASYFATGYAHPITVMVTPPDDPETNQEYMKQGPFFSWSLVSVSSPNLSVTLSDPHNQSSLTVTGTSSVAGTYTAIIRVEYYRQKRLNVNDAWTDYGADGENITLSYNFADVTVKVWDKVNEEWVASTSIAAGGIQSYVHQADVLISADVEAEVEIIVQMSDGNGFDANSPYAVLVLGDNECVLSPSNTLGYISTNAYGLLTGVLTSSNLVNGSATVTSCQSSSTVSFGWDNYTDDDKWEIYPSVLIIDSTNYIGTRIAFNGIPMDGHELLMTVSQIVYEDESGEHIVNNTPESPTDMSYWVDFDNPICTTDYYGYMSTNILLKYTCVNVTWIQLRVYDLSTKE